MRWLLIMKINFLTTRISNASGGAIYDSNFFKILKEIYPEVNLFDDYYFIDKFSDGSGLISFNKYYRNSIDDLLQCDYLIINSRLYTRMMLFNVKNELKKHPNTKLIVIHHHSNFMNNRYLLRLVHRFFEKRVLEAASEIIIPNDYVVAQVKKDFNVKKIKVLPSSFEKKKHIISTLKSDYLLFVGNIEYRKGLLYGLKAFKMISDKRPGIKYRIVGKYDNNDPYYKKLIKYVVDNRMEEKVIFEGRVSEERLERLYENAKLFLFPSLLEGYGWVLVEAMGHGVPVVSFDNSAMPYTVRNGINGVLVKNKSISEMASKTLELIDDDAQMTRLQCGALKTYEQVPSQEELNIATDEYIRSWK